MAGKGGGAWKVAYADFVTAMMAFFLVMWITAQDQKFKEAIAHYFVDPMGYHSIGTNSRAGSGALADGPLGSTVPNGGREALGRGRMSQTDQGTVGPVTEMVTGWLFSDSASYAQCRKLAQDSQAEAERSYEVVMEEADATEVAVSLLADKLHRELVKKAPDPKGMYGELIQHTLDTVQWREIADDLLSQ
jgi:flagellar motor protein MotB